MKPEEFQEGLQRLLALFRRLTSQIANHGALVIAMSAATPDHQSSPPGSRSDSQPIDKEKTVQVTAIATKIAGLNRRIRIYQHLQIKSGTKKNHQLSNPLGRHRVEIWMKKMHQQINTQGIKR